MADVDDSTGPPPFEDAFSGGDIEQRIYGTILLIRAPTAASAIAADVECDPKTARKYIDWFAELGIVIQHEGRPTTYERNDSYFAWRRINQLAPENSLEELHQRIGDLSKKIGAYEQEYGTTMPGEVDALAVAEASTSAAFWID